MAMLGTLELKLVCAMCIVYLYNFFLFWLMLFYERENRKKNIREEPKSFRAYLYHIRNEIIEIVAITKHNINISFNEHTLIIVFLL